MQTTPPFSYTRSKQAGAPRPPLHVGVHVVLRLRCDHDVPRHPERPDRLERYLRVKGVRGGPWWLLLSHIGRRKTTTASARFRRGMSSLGLHMRPHRGRCSRCGTSRGARWFICTPARGQQDAVNPLGHLLGAGLPARPHDGGRALPPAAPSSARRKKALTEP